MFEFIKDNWIVILLTTVMVIGFLYGLTQPYRPQDKSILDEYKSSKYIDVVIFSDTYANAEVELYKQYEKSKYKIVDVLVQYRVYLKKIIQSLPDVILSAKTHEVVVQKNDYNEMLKELEKTYPSKEYQIINYRKEFYFRIVPIDNK